MTNDDRYTEGDETASARLVAALRAEIVELELDDEPEDVLLPDGIRRLLLEAAVPAKIASVVDDLVASDEPMSDDFVAALKASVREAQEELGTGIVFLEHHVAHRRAQLGTDSGTIAAQLNTSAELVEQIEAGLRAFNDGLDAEQVAGWISLLELDPEGSVEALRLSLHSPAMSYAGDPEDHKRVVVAFVDDVRRILGAKK